MFKISQTHILNDDTVSEPLIFHFLLSNGYSNVIYFIYAVYMNRIFVLECACTSAFKHEAPNCQFVPVTPVTHLRTFSQTLAENQGRGR